MDIKIKREFIEYGDRTHEDFETKYGCNTIHHSLFFARSRY